MKITDFLKCVFCIVFLCLPISSLADSTNKITQQTTEVACRYEMSVIPHDKSQATSNTAWFFWRTPNMIQTLVANGDHGEIWQRTVNGSIQYRKLYHSDKTAVEYMPADIPTNNMNFDWFKLSTMLTQQELNALKPVKTTQVLGRNAVLRTGKTNGQTLEVLWLSDENLPASITRNDENRTVALRLVEITPLSAAPHKPIAVEDITNYRHIDAADFGDMENDPFVKKMMAADGHHH